MCEGFNYIMTIQMLLCQLSFLSNKRKLGSTEQCPEWTINTDNSTAELKRSRKTAEEGTALGRHWKAPAACITFVFSAHISGTDG